MYLTHETAWRWLADQKINAAADAAHEWINAQADKYLDRSKPKIYMTGTKANPSALFMSEAVLRQLASLGERSGFADHPRPNQLQNIYNTPSYWQQNDLRINRVAGCFGSVMGGLPIFTNKNVA